MNYDILYAAWRKIGADLTGLVWADFVDAIEDQKQTEKPFVEEKTELKDSVNKTTGQIDFDSYFDNL